MHPSSDGHRRGFGHEGHVAPPRLLGGRQHWRGHDGGRVGPGPHAHQRLPPVGGAPVVCGWSGDPIHPPSVHGILGWQRRQAVHLPGIQGVCVRVTVPGPRSLPKCALHIGGLLVSTTELDLVGGGGRGPQDRAAGCASAAPDVCTQIIPGGASGSTSVYEDDGRTTAYLTSNAFAWTTATYTTSGSSLTVTIVTTGTYPGTGCGKRCALMLFSPIAM